eukprot:CAMPEP_0172546016 /NCGR_PEP_ID=MMETSP1067-20121228/15842_1 /TAXON_ID=265564 ORGANISM="Thalassiosira punctigera, Strain Tpunct2005C2" /NCGR_SAMPLE_ID=MMETSP1067 /ASSEMBLY_ACC=CAM_ASM_000444 /LENGTH=379 /DNA_ID=CAMNT_0013332875 /DNA_START=183 /DNA_END=1322 /DNA_ORIENTATION=-
MASSDAKADNDQSVILKERAKSAFRYTEDIAPGCRIDMTLHAILHSSVSDFQEVQVIESYFGRTLVTDGKTQSAEHDEFVYHESLVHPPLFWSAILSGRNNDGGDGGPKRVFIGGGGELATAREVLRHNTVERLVMVDIDPAVIEVCKKYLPEWGGDAVANHPKMELIIGDAHKYLMETDENFDVIIMDISDPIEAGPGIALYTQEFYNRAADVLSKENGIFVTQAGSANYVPAPHSFPKEEGDNSESTCFSPIMNTLATVFDHAVPYSVPMPSFGEDWGFVMAFNGPDVDAAGLIDLSPATIDALVEERIETVSGVPEHRFRSIGINRATTGRERGGDVLKHYDGKAHRGMFTLSKMLRGGMKSDKRIMTEENPIFMF